MKKRRTNGPVFIIAVPYSLIEWDAYPVLVRWMNRISCVPHSDTDPFDHKQQSLASWSFPCFRAKGTFFSVKHFLSLAIILRYNPCFIT